MTDYHAGGDHLAALRDPGYLAIDLLENKQFVIDKLKQAEGEFFKVYDYFYKLLRKNNQLTTGWLPLFSESKYHIASNDFSCMISNKMFEEFFLEGIIVECKVSVKSTLSTTQNPTPIRQFLSPRHQLIQIII